MKGTCDVDFDEPCTDAVERNVREVQFTIPSSSGSTYGSKIATVMPATTAATIGMTILG